MDDQEFTFSFHTEVEHITETQKQALRDEAERRLVEMAGQHNDMTGASVVIDQPAHRQTPFLYRVNIVAYVRPDNVDAEGKGETMQGTLRDALDAIERQIRERRERLRTRWKQP